MCCCCWFSYSCVLYRLFLRVGAATSNLPPSTYLSLFARCPCNEHMVNRPTIKVVVFYDEIFNRQLVKNGKSFTFQPYSNIIVCDAHRWLNKCKSSASIPQCVGVLWTGTAHTISLFVSNCFFIFSFSLCVLYFAQWVRDVVGERLQYAFVREKDTKSWIYKRFGICFSPFLMKLKSEKAKMMRQLQW